MEKTDQFEKVLHEASVQRMNKFEQDFDNSLSELQSLYANYSISDVLNSLFTVSLWLRNISSQVRMQFAYMALTSMKLAGFTSDNKITNYLDFSGFTERLIAILPEFPMFEDYIPEPDWGNVKYYHNRRQFKMFYGNNLDGVYEFIEAYNLKHSTIDETYVAIIGRSPENELHEALTLQESIINSIRDNYTVEDSLGISPGHFELPSADFWRSCISYYSGLLAGNIYENLNKQFSIKIGDTAPEHLTMEAFLNDFHENKNFRFMFIEYEEKHYPILPRRYPSILVSEWGDLHHEHEAEILQREPGYRHKLDFVLAQYLEHRTKDIIHRSVSAFDKEKRTPSETVYSMAFTTKNKLYLIYLLDPCYSDEETQNRIDTFAETCVKDIEILKQQPTTLLLRETGRVISFESNNGEIRSIIPEVITLIPRINIALGMIGIPKELPGQLMFLEDFLGIVDEIKNVNEIEDFYDFLTSQHKTRNPYNTILDLFGAYRDSVGILIGGAIEPTSISLGSGWGSNFRYESLRKFWDLYPGHNLYAHPRTYELHHDGYSLRLVARNEFMIMYHERVGEMDVFINGPLHRLDTDKGRVTDLLMQILQDELRSYKEMLSTHPFFASYKKMHLFVFPYDAVSSNNDLKHLVHLSPGDEMFTIDCGFPEASVPSVRLSYDYQKVYNALIESTDRKFEGEVMKCVLSELNKISQTDLMEVCIAIDADSSKPPRFKINVFERPASFPDFERPVLPQPRDYKAAKKLIAQMALKSDFKPGKYSVADAESLLNNLKHNLIEYINEKVMRFDLKKAIGFLITKTDAISHKYEMNKMTYEIAKNQEINYSREERYSKNHTRYVKDHKNFRYLIEKFVQLTPTGSETMYEDDMKELLGLIDWLHVIQNGSDMIHYRLAPTGVTVDEDFRVDVDYNEDFESKEHAYGLQEASLDLETSGNPGDRLVTAEEKADFFNKLNEAFLPDFGFSLHELTSVLEVLIHWPVAEGLGEGAEKGYYSASMDRLYDVCKKTLVEEISRSSFEKIIDFLTLKSAELLITIDATEKCADLPIWEHNKRPMRLNLKPLILIDEIYFWGAYSVNKTREIWIGNAMAATFPFEIKSKNIKSLLDEEKQRVSKALNDKAGEIVSRVTMFSKVGCELHRVDKAENYPVHLGDYDVLAFIPETNTIVNVECKDLEPPFCIKDARRLRERLFGKDDTNRGYFEKVLRRETFLKDNSVAVMQSLKWPLDQSKPVNIVSLFVTRRNYWWTTFPPFDIDMDFVRIDLLDEYLKKLKK